MAKSLLLASHDRANVIWECAYRVGTKKICTPAQCAEKAFFLSVFIESVDLNGLQIDQPTQITKGLNYVWR